MVISSSGEAAQYDGHALGQYEYLEDKGYYVQTSTEQSDENFRALYLYLVDDIWFVSGTTTFRGGWLRNPNSSQTPPTSGWQYADYDGWHDDPTLTVTPGPLPPLPRQFTVTAKGAAAELWPCDLGVFTKTERWWDGRPVYANTGGRLLHHGAGDAGWQIANKLGTNVLRGSQSHHSPTEEKSWRYWTGSRYKPASVTVTGSE